MPCACNGGATGGQDAKATEARYEVRLPGGRTTIVTGEHAAKVEVTMAGGGTYSIVR